MKKNILITSILSTIIIVTVVGAFYFSTVSAQSGLVTTTENVGGASSDVVAQKLVSKINILRSVTLKGDMFKSPSFISLVDWSKPLPDQEVGRNNPFAPIGQ
jgi:hypothetical protein